MKPYVIDRRQLNFYIFFAIVLIVTSFFLGYFTAQYRLQNAPLSLESEPATQPEPESELQKNTDPELPEVSLKAQNAVTDNDKVSPANKISKTEVSTASAAKPVAPGTRSKPPTVSQNKPAAAVVKQPVPPVAPVTSSVNAIAREMTEVGSQAGNLDSDSVTPDSFRYSVQAGMFGNLDNASRFLDQLQTAGFDGYMEEHEGTDGAIRYNVRFGRFASRAEAEQRIERYKRSFSTPAYVIINP